MIALHVVLALYALAVGPLSRSGLLKMRYSKFRTGDGISGRLGMFLLYFLPLVALVPASWSYLPRATLVQWVLFAAIGGHFLKRCLEVLVVHKYSGPIDVWTVGTVT